jgi:alkanesulfonate monooxygenase SsuD/methylene tetrahydromethanopterin reductase-like flavin-dependent oxidoreductase (luciferase family)
VLYNAASGARAVDPMNAIGVRIRDADLSLAAMRDLVGVAERAGYDSAWLPEGIGRDSIAELIALLSAGQRITLATGIVPVFAREPTLTSAAMATAAALAPGRVILGVGIGHKNSLVAGHGVAFSRPLKRTREFTEIARRLLAGESLAYAGDIFNIARFQVDCTPSVAVPVYVAALRPAMLRMAGAVADGVLLNWATPQRIREAIEHVHAGARAAGRAPQEVRIACYLRTCVSDDSERIEAASREQIARYGSMLYYRNYFAEIGFAAEASALEAAWSKGDAAAAAQVVDRRMIQALTIYGSAEQCRERLAVYRSAGLDLPIIAPFPIGEPIAQTFARTIAGCALAAQ